MDTEKFIEKSKNVHKNKYDYKNTVYVSHKDKVCITCPIHGEFFQNPYDHLSGKGCPKCGGKNKLTTEEFIRLFKSRFGDGYDCSDVEYVNSKTKVCIICPKHGKNYVAPYRLLLNKYPCYKCSVENRSEERKLGNDVFIERAKKVHGDKYDYSKVEYVNNHTKVCIICREHGEFWQTPDKHLNSFGCRLCSNEHRSASKKKTTDSIIERFKDVHGDKYDYSKVDYDGVFSKVCIICPKHGEFWQTPDNHLHGKGCPTCNQSKLEEDMSVFLTEKGVDFVVQKRFEWLTHIKPMALDFYLPKYNVAIECQGKQHFKELLTEKASWFNGERNYEIIEGKVEEIIERDTLKRKLCEEHGIKVFYFSNLDIEYPYKVYEDKDEILNAIDYGCARCPKHIGET